ncbi:TPA: hypothetical protein NGR29_004441 [Vibrio parahaemolyticus]|nr:hypothetical protein [Vibrio parahaemolyticus]
MNNATIVLNESLPFFPREVQLDGKRATFVVTCSMSNAFEETDRLRHLLTRLIFDHDIDVETLNSIGFSKEDANSLSMEIPGLTHETPPKWKE